MSFWLLTGGVNHLSMSRLDLHFKILSELLVVDWGVNHLSMSRLELHFKILSALLVVRWGVQSSFHVQAGFSL